MLARESVRREVVVLAVSVVFILGWGAVAHAAVFTQIIPNEWEFYDEGDLDWSDSDDDSSTGSTALGFSVTIGGATYDYFDLNSNGYIELLVGAGDVPVDNEYDSVADLIAADSNSTYLLAAYDDLSSEFYNFYGYKLLSDRAVFYYDTETYDDDDDDLPNVFQVILFDDGNVQWNFRWSNYKDYDYDLFSGLYFGNTGTLLELISDDIPQLESYLYVPEPATLSLLAFGAMALMRRKRK